MTKNAYSKKKTAIRSTVRRMNKNGPFAKNFKIYVDGFYVPSNKKIFAAHLIFYDKTTGNYSSSFYTLEDILKVIPVYDDYTLFVDAIRTHKEVKHTRVAIFHHNSCAKKGASVVLKK